jgi:hypothetical protein
VCKYIIPYIDTQIWSTTLYTDFSVICVIDLLCYTLSAILTDCIGVSGVSREIGELMGLSFGDLVSLFPILSYVSYVSILLSYILNSLSYSLYRLVFVVLAELFLLYVSDLF